MPSDRFPALFELQLDWLSEGLRDGGLISRYLDESSVLDRTDLIANLSSDIVNGVCTSVSKRQFHRWARLRIQRHAEQLRPFHLIDQLRKQKKGPLTLADVRRILLSHGRMGTEKTGFPPYVVKDGVAHITLPSGNVLKVPALADCDDPSRNFLPVLEWLWPWKEVSGRIVKTTTRQTHTGRWVPSTMSVHTLWAAFGHRDKQFVSTAATNGDWLDWRPGNIVPIHHNPLGRLGKGEREFLIKQELKEAAWRQVRVAGQLVHTKVDIDPELLLYWSEFWVDKLNRGQLNQLRLDASHRQFETDANGEQIEPEGADPTPEVD